MLVYRGAITSAEDRYTSPTEECEKHLGHVPQGVDPKAEAVAVVNCGRWIVPCPWCYSASMAHRTDKRFHCVECQNHGSGKWAKVTWPDQPDEIEAVLSMRPDPRTRNWAPPETLGDLLAENISHGVM